MFSLFTIILFLFLQKSHHLFFHRKFQFSNVFISIFFQFTVHYFSKNFIPLSRKVSIFLYTYFSSSFILLFYFYFISHSISFFLGSKHLIDTNNIILQSEMKISPFLSPLLRDILFDFFSIC